MIHNAFKSLFVLLLTLTSLAAYANEDLAKLTQINRYWNDNIIQGADKDIWGVENYWATPQETLEKGMGDCEDIAIGKLFSALESGIDPAKLRLAHVVLTHRSGEEEAHMVLAYYETPTSEPLYLDNTTALIRPASKREDLREVVTLGFEGIFVNNLKRANANQSKLWTSLVSRTSF